MTSYPKDSAGVDFDPAKHQKIRGKPRLNKAGEFIVNRPPPARQPKAKPEPEGPKAEATPEGAPESPAKAEAPKPEPVGLSPELRQIAPATPEEILGTALPPVTKAPDGGEAPAQAGEAEPQSGEAQPAPATPPVADGSYMAPDAPPAPAADAGLKARGFAAAIIGVGEMTARVSIDAEECELNPIHREALISSLSAALEHSNLNPDTGPWGDVVFTAIGVGSHHAAKPKTRTWLAEKWAFIRVKWFGAKPPEEAKNPPAKPDTSAN